MNKMKMILYKLLKGFIFLIGALLILFTLIAYIREATKVYIYHRAGSVESGLRWTEDSLLVFNRVENSEFQGPILPVSGDTLISINDSSATRDLNARYFRSPLGPDQEFPIVFQHNGNFLTARIKAHRPDTVTFFQIIVLEIIRALLALCFIFVGFWAFLKRPDSAGIRALTMFCYGMAGFFTFGVIAILDSYALFSIPLQNVLRMVFGLLSISFGAFWLNLVLLFPRPKKLMKNYPIWVYLGLYSPLILAVILQSIGVSLPDITGLIIISLQIGAGFTILAVSHSRARDKIEKRQIDLVLWGTGIGLSLLFILLVVAVVVFNEWFSNFRWNALLVTFFFLPLLLSPISFAYAFGRYRLLEVEGKIRRGTRYIAMTVLVLAVFVGFIYLVGELLLRQFGISDRTPTFMVALGLALGFTPALRRFQHVMEKRFYPERHSLRVMVREFLQKVLSVPDRETLWDRIELRLGESLGIEHVYPVLRKTGESGFIHDREKREELTPFDANQELIYQLQISNHPLLVDEAVASGRVAMSVEAYSWLVNRNIALLLPMVVQSNLIGFLGLAYKKGGEDYSPEDLQILSALGSQVALAFENIRLLEDNIVKKRMEEELQLARRIQQRFLPQQIPETPGLEIAAESRFCLEVAGDYYDVISLSGGHTVLAVGDVSGKGAGAALLMANLQASLRTAVGVGANLGDLVSRINDLIYQNTPQEQFITFFVALFNPQNRTLTYVNAGHNPPCLVQKDGECRLLTTGGLILGVLPGMEYECEIINLNSGDLILLFTDGLTEAMNASGEEFGELRALEYVKTHRNSSLKEILSNLEEEAKRFTQDAPWMDDLTLLLARVQ